ncbi:MAG: hypothetical protein C0501_04400 [Isosphaera sp.]|nr:hypothetical protein [Isosphaera sp.]
MNVRTLPVADDDATAAGDRLEARQAGLGARFALEFGRAVAAIEADPRLHPRTEDGPDEPETREFYIARFQYRVIYAIWKDEAVVVAVTHARRRSGSWQSRLAELD